MCSVPLSLLLELDLASQQASLSQEETSWTVASYHPPLILQIAHILQDSPWVEPKQVAASSTGQVISGSQAGCSLPGLAPSRPPVLISSFRWLWITIPSQWDPQEAMSESVLLPEAPTGWEQ